MVLIVITELGLLSKAKSLTNPGVNLYIKTHEK